MPFRIRVSVKATDNLINQLVNLVRAYRPTEALLVVDVDAMSSIAERLAERASGTGVEGNH